MRYFVLFLFFSLAFSFNDNNETEPGLQIWLAEEAGEHFCTTIFIQSTNDQTISIGTSSVFVEYDKTNLTFLSYTPVWFDDKTKCEMMPLPGYGAQNHYADYEGVVNITLTNVHPQLACPIVGDIPTAVGELCFEVSNLVGDYSVNINPTHTHFNEASLELKQVDNILVLE